MRALIEQQQTRRTLADDLADLAVAALIDEAELSPKPALVDRRGNGAHDDLSLELMRASARSLWPAFQTMAAAGQGEGEVSQALRETIGRLGREGEAEMMAVTAGVNTHRGAIWALGLLTTAAAIAPRAGSLTLASRAAELACLADRQAPMQAPSHGERVQQRYGARGARAEAQAGFPAVIERGLPQLRISRAAGHGETHARLDALLAIMTRLEDTCVLHRAGLEGQACMQQGARAVLAAGGSATLAGRRALKDLEQDLLGLNASPGGAADLLAATLFLDRLDVVRQAQIGSL